MLHSEDKIVSVPIPGAVTSIANQFGEQTIFHYNAEGNEICRSLANGLTVEQTYDKAGRKTAVRQINTAGQEITAFFAEYDGVGNLTKVREHDGTEARYEYDASGQLIKEKRVGVAPADVAYTYDPLGNRLTMTDSGRVTSYTYNKANALIAVAKADRTVSKFEYDASGNLLSKDRNRDRTHYSWDFSNRLVSITDPVVGTEAFEYDADGLRTKAVSPSATRCFIRDHNNVIEETDAHGGAKVWYTHAPGRWGNPISLRSDGHSAFYGFDHSENTRSIADGAGHMIALPVYDAFGRDLTDVPGNTTLGFGGRVGYYSDSRSGLVYIRARWYDPAIGRWITKDPIGFRGGDWNLYRYARNSTLLNLDPSGLDCNPTKETNNMATCSELANDSDVICLLCIHPVIIGLCQAGVARGLTDCDCLAEISADCQPGSSCGHKIRYEYYIHHKKKINTQKKKWHPGYWTNT